MSSTSNSCIDNILHNICDRKVSTGVMDPSISDHKGQYINIRLGKPPSKNNNNLIMRHFSVNKIEDYFLKKYFSYEIYFLMTIVSKMNLLFENTDRIIQKFN